MHTLAAISEPLLFHGSAVIDGAEEHKLLRDTERERENISSHLVHVQPASGHLVPSPPSGKVNFNTSEANL